jgi:hypothetical protein
VIPNSVTEIGTTAFYGSPLTSVTIGANVSLLLESDAFLAKLLTPAFGQSFSDFYDGNGKKAGTYTYSNGRWSYQQ